MVPTNELLLQDWLRSHLKKSGAIARLGREAGLARTTIYRILNGTTEPDPATIVSIARALGVPAPHVERVLIVKEAAAEETALTLIASAQQQLNLAAKKIKSQDGLPVAPRKEKSDERVARGVKRKRKEE